MPIISLLHWAVLTSFLAALLAGPGLSLAADLSHPSVLKVETGSLRENGIYVRCQGHHRGTLQTVPDVADEKYSLRKEPWSMKVKADNKVAADHLFELQIIAEAMNIFKYPLSRWSPERVKLIKSLANAQENIQNIDANLNLAKATMTTKFLKDIDGGGIFKQCEPFAAAPTQGEDENVKNKRQSMLKVQTYVKSNCYRLLAVAEGIHDIVIKTDTPDKNDSYQGPNLLALTKEVLRCFHIHADIDAECVNQPIP